MTYDAELMCSQVFASWSVAAGCSVMLFIESGQTDQTGLSDSGRMQLVKGKNNLSDLKAVC